MVGVKVLSETERFYHWMKNQPKVKEDDVQWAEILSEIFPTSMQGALMYFPKKVFDKHLAKWYERFVVEDASKVVVPRVWVGE